MRVGCTPDCSCTLKPASCHQVTRRCKVPSVCVLEESRIQFGGLFKNKYNTNIPMPHRSDIIPLAVWWGVSVVRSQKRTVVSPEPLARYLKQDRWVKLISLQKWVHKRLKQETELERFSYSLAGGAKSGWDDGLCVSLKSAGAAGHGSDPEHSLRLVHHRENLLRLNPKSLHAGTQAGHHLSLTMYKKGQRNWLLLWEIMTKTNM